MSKKIQFLVLPYVDFRQDFSFNEFRIWQNTIDNWKKYCGIDNTEFLNMFLDEEGSPLQDKIYIISSVSSYIPYQKWERLIHVLFYLSFGFPNLASDDFHFEIWEQYTNRLRKGYTKYDKFSKNIVAPGTKVKIYPDQYVRYNSLKSIDPLSSEYYYFQNQFLDDYNSSILRSISYFFKTQYRNISHFSELDDILNFCSAFQTFLEVANRQDIGKILADKLANSFNVEEKIKKRIKDWMNLFYGVRSNYTHGGLINYEDLNYEYVRHIDVASKVFKALMMRQHSSGLDDLINAPINEIFDAQPNFESLIHLLSKAHAKDHIFDCDEIELKRIRNLLFDFKLNTETSHMHYENKNKLRTALKTILHIYGQLITDYLGNREKGEAFYVEPLKKIKSILDSDDSFERKLDTLPQIYFEARDYDQYKEEVVLREIIPLGHLIEAYGKILEIYRR